MTADPIPFLHAGDVDALGIPASELADALGPAPDDDPHESCWGIHLGADGEHYTCDGRPI